MLNVLLLLALLGVSVLWSGATVTLGLVCWREIPEMWREYSGDLFMKLISILIVFTVGLMGLIASTFWYITIDKLVRVVL